jgi:hypothetical protein
VNVSCRVPVISGIARNTRSGSRPAIIDVMDTAAARRNRMQVRVYPSLSAHDRDDARFWAALPVEERVLQVWKLSEAQWRLRGEFPDESGLPRSVARVHRP